MGPRSPGTEELGLEEESGTPRYNEGGSRDGEESDEERRRTVTVVMMRDMKDGRVLQPRMKDHEESGVWERGQRTEGH